MITLKASVCIDAPAAVAWAQLAKLEDIQLWSEAILRAHCAEGRASGVGAERICDLAGNLTIREHWVAWDEGRSFQYEGYGIPMVCRATNRWSVVPQGNQSLLVSEATVELKGGVFGRLLEPIMGPLMQRMARFMAAGFRDICSS